MTIQGIRLVIAASAVASVSLLTPVYAHAPGAPSNCVTATQSSSQVPMSGASSPSKLDYVVLASLADAPSLLSLSGYRAAAPAPAAN
jgi:hypothetical protein